MIYTDEQYGNTADILSKFRVSLAAARGQSTGDEWIPELVINALQAQISELGMVSVRESISLRIRKPCTHNICNESLSKKPDYRTDTGDVSMLV